MASPPQGGAAATALRHPPGQLEREAAPPPRRALELGSPCVVLHHERDAARRPLRPYADPPARPRGFQGDQDQREKSVIDRVGIHVDVGERAGDLDLQAHLAVGTLRERALDRAQELLGSDADPGRAPREERPHLREERSGLRREILDLGRSRRLARREMRGETGRGEQVPDLVADRHDQRRHVGAPPARRAALDFPPLTRHAAILRWRGPPVTRELGRRRVAWPQPKARETNQ